MGQQHKYVSFLRKHREAPKPTLFVMFEKTLRFLRRKQKPCGDTRSAKTLDCFRCPFQSTPKPTLEADKMASRSKSRSRPIRPIKIARNQYMC